MRRDGRTGARGYVLLSTVIALAVMAVIVSRYASLVEREHERVLAAASEVQAELRADSLYEALLVAISTQPLSERGFGRYPNPEWIADGRWYRAADGLYFSVQDQRGLLSLHDSDQRALGRLLESQGLALAQQQRLLDVLGDYVDTDSLRRLSGAEAPDYELEALPPPRNDFIRTLGELPQMPGWRDHPTLIERISPWLSVRVSGQFNPNTAPLAALEAMLRSSSPGQLAAFVRMREAAPFRDGASAQATTGLPLNRDDFMFFSSNEFVVRVWAEGLPMARAYNLRLEPGGLFAPWLVTAYQRVQRPKFPNASVPAIDSPVPLPTLPNQPL